MCFPPLARRTTRRAPTITARIASFREFRMARGKRAMISSIYSALGAQEILRRKDIDGRASSKLVVSKVTSQRRRRIRPARAPSARGAASR
eukprot:7480881-Pyramimonas_sp.AAC.1